MCAVNQTAGSSVVDLFDARDRVLRLFSRKTGPQPYSRLLIETQLPQHTLDTVLRLLEAEKKIKQAEQPPQADEAQYVKPSGVFSGF